MDAVIKKAFHSTREGNFSLIFGKLEVDCKFFYDTPVYLPMTLGEVALKFGSPGEPYK